MLGRKQPTGMRPGCRPGGLSRDSCFVYVSRAGRMRMSVRRDSTFSRPRSRELRRISLRDRPRCRPGPLTGRLLRHSRSCRGGRQDRRLDPRRPPGTPWSDRHLFRARPRPGASGDGVRWDVRERCPLKRGLTFVCQFKRIESTFGSNIQQEDIKEGIAANTPSGRAIRRHSAVAEWSTGKVGG